MTSYKTDILYVISGLQEKKSYMKLDKENTSSRPQKFIGHKNRIYFRKSMDKNCENKCVPSMYSKENLHVLPDICTYCKKMKFFGKEQSQTDGKTIWNNIIEFVKYTKPTSPTSPTSPANVKTNYFVVSHHGTMRKSILPILIDNEIEKIANCACFILEKIDGHWILKLAFDGFPDKNQKYYSLRKGGKDILIKTKKYIPILNDLDENVRIFIIRHGNAYHNYPLKMRGTIFNRTVDTNLTPLGIYQARVLGQTLIKKEYLKNDNNENSNFFCSSNMNRSQHTALELVKTLNHASSKNHSSSENLYPELSKLEVFFTDMAITRLIRKSGGLDLFKDNLKLLINWAKNYTEENIAKYNLSIVRKKRDMKSKLDYIVKDSINLWKSNIDYIDF